MLGSRWKQSSVIYSAPESRTDARLYICMRWYVMWCEVMRKHEELGTVQRASVDTITVRCTQWIPSSFVLLPSLNQQTRSQIFVRLRLRRLGPNDIHLFKMKLCSRRDCYLGNIWQDVIKWSLQCGIGGLIIFLKLNFTTVRILAIISLTTLYRRLFIKYGVLVVPCIYSL